MHRRGHVIQDVFNVLPLSWSIGSQMSTYSRRSSALSKLQQLIVVDRIAAVSVEMACEDDLDASTEC